MNIVDLCIKRPVFTVMLVMLPVIFGAISLNRMGVGLFPDVDLPVVTITTARPGASAEEMENGVTKLIEEEVNTISDIDELRSGTSEGFSRITVQFKLSKDSDVGFQEVQSAITRLVSRLPSGTETPVVDKFEVGASPVMTIAVSAPRDMRELREIADTQVADAFGGLPGVGSVTVVGGRKRAIQVAIDAAKLESYGLSIQQVKQALSSQNIELPGGRVNESGRELVLRTLGRVTDPMQIAEIIVATREGQPVRIRDLGGPHVVQDSFEEPRSRALLYTKGSEGKNTVMLTVTKQSGANTVTVIDDVKARLEVIKAGLEASGRGDLQLEVIKDQSRFIKASLHEVQVHLVLGAILVVLTIIAFLRDWRATIIAAVAIPASLMAAFPVMEAFSLTIDNITLIALVLVIGIVIDDAVIILENIVRWMEEEDLSPTEAAVKGTKEITLAVVATTLSLAVIFIPIAMMGGTVGRFLKSFGITAAVCILVSLFISLTLTPMLSARWLRKSKHPGNHGSGESKGVYGWLVEKPYMAALRFSMRRRWVIVLAVLLSLGAVVPVPPIGYPGLIGMVGFDFIPKDDQSEFEITIETPEGWSLERVDQTFAEIENRVRQYPEVITVLGQIGDTSGRRSKAEGKVTRGVIYARLIDLKERDAPWTQADIMARARAMMRDYPDLRASVAAPRAIQGGGFSSYDIEHMILGPDLEMLREYSSRMIDKLKTNPGLADVSTTLSERRPEMLIRVDRERASDAGVTIVAIASTMRTLVGGEIVSDYKDELVGETYDVWLRAEGIDRKDSVAVGNLLVPGKDGSLVRLSSIATPFENLGPAEIDRASRQRKISIVANLSGLASSDASALMVKTFQELDAPPTYSIVSTGGAKNQQESNQAFLLAFAFSLLLMYMILAAQFESFVHPITILLAVPLTIPFALLSQVFFGTPLSLFSLLGIFLLFGIVKKNGILQVDYTNTLRTRLAEDASIVPAPYNGVSTGHGGWWERFVLKQSEPKRQRLWAIMEANKVRLRPILMTTVMLVAAMIPIALGKGPGAANRGDMAKVIIGGQTLSLLLSLLVTPVAYSLFDDFSMWFRRRISGKSAGGSAPQG